MLIIYICIEWQSGGKWGKTQRKVKIKTLNFGHIISIISAIYEVYISFNSNYSQPLSGFRAKANNIVIKLYLSL